MKKKTTKKKSHLVKLPGGDLIDPRAIIAVKTKKTVQGIGSLDPQQNPCYIEIIYWGGRDRDAIVLPCDSNESRDAKLSEIEKVLL